MDINRLLTKTGNRVISFQPRVELPAHNLPSILPGVHKVPVPFLSSFIFSLYFSFIPCSDFCSLLFSSDGSQEESRHHEGEGGCSGRLGDRETKRVSDCCCEGSRAPGLRKGPHEDPVIVTRRVEMVTPQPVPLRATPTGIPFTDVLGESPRVSVQPSEGTSSSVGLVRDRIRENLLLRDV